MICPNCGKESNARFCIFCGTPMAAPGGPAGPVNGPAGNTNAPKKGGNKTVLWIILGALAALLLAGGVFLFFALRNGSSKKTSLEPHLIIYTRDGGMYVDNEEGVIVDRSDYTYLAENGKAALYGWKNRIYYLENGEETQIGGANAELNGADDHEFAWVEFIESNGDFCLFISKLKEEIVLAEKGKEQMGWGYPSRDGKYYAYICYSGKNYATYSLRCVDLSTGEISIVAENKDGIGLRGVDDTGVVYYVDDNGKSYAAKEDAVQIKGISDMTILDGILLCKSLSRNEEGIYYKRPLGLSGELKALSETVDEDILEALDDSRKCIYLQEDPYQLTITSNHGSTGAMATNYVILEEDGDLFFLDLKEGKAELLMEDVSVKEVDTIHLLKDRKTLYLEKEYSLYKLTHSTKGWEKERITKHLSSLRGVYEKGMVFREDDKVCVYNGKEVYQLAYAEESFDVSENLECIVYSSGSRILYTAKDAEEKMRLAGDYGERGLALFKDYVYYVNDDDELVRINPLDENSEPEVIMEDVTYIYHEMY